MFKLIVLYAIIAIVAGRPYADYEYRTPLSYSTPYSYQNEYVNYQEPILTKFGQVVASIPTSNSYQRQAIYHNKINQVAPIYATAIKTYVTPIIKKYSAPLLPSYADSLSYENYGKHW